jgi:type II secretion system protein J
LPDSPAKTTPSSRTLLQPLEALSFAYLDQKGRFHNYWPVKGEEKNHLPRAVRITLHLKGLGNIEQLYSLTGQTLDAKP